MNRFFAACCALFLTTGILHAEDRPNIVWIFAEDTSPWMGCYGHEANAMATPNIDSIAAAGVRFDRALFRHPSVPLVALR